MSISRSIVMLGPAEILVGLACMAVLGEPSVVEESVGITVDTTEVPDCAAWGLKAKSLCETWYPVIARLLPSEGFRPPDRVKLVFKKDMKGVAGTSGSTILIAADWVKQHPDDLGMVIHELTHVVQSYPRYQPGWLIEGIADYIRHRHFEPDAPVPAINPATASYRDGYKTTAAFLAWAESSYDPRLVAKLNQALRASRYREDLFHDSTGKNLEELWSEFVKTLPKK